MDAASELRQAHRTAALITGGLITFLVMDAVIASVFRMSHAPYQGDPAIAGFVLVILGGLFLDFYLLGSVSLARLLADAPRYEAWEAWLATPAPRP